MCSGEEQQIPGFGVVNWRSRKTHYSYNGEIKDLEKPGSEISQRPTDAVMLKEEIECAGVIIKQKKKARKRILMIKKLSIGYRELQLQGIFKEKRICEELSPRIKFGIGERRRKMTKSRAIEVDEFSCTSVQSIWPLESLLTE